MFYHGWDAYENNAFPSDELRPLTCDGLDRDFLDPMNIGLNDVLGNYSLTLIDSLDMFAILGQQKDFERYVELASKLSFNVSSTVQVFETTIRAMGGLLSAHLYASVPRLGSAIDGYDGQLLKLAHELGLRLLPAFDTPSGIPTPRVNLVNGVNDEICGISETCASGAGSLLLEFGLLSRLTGDSRFEFVARRAFFALYMRRTDIDMLSMAVDSQSGNWLTALTGNGASIDSYYEYALKYSILFNDNDMMTVFNRLYRALKSHSFNGWTFRNIHYQKAYQLVSWIDSLASFFTSLMVLVGDIESAVHNHLTYYKLWTTFAGIPERWTFIPHNLDALKDPSLPVTLEWYPLRPEFIESNYYLYQATKDPMFLHIGKTAMQDLQENNKVPCGYAGTQDVRTGALSNRMESFFLSETAKYFYLLFKRDHPLNNDSSNWVFSTEAHPFWYDKDVLAYAGHENFDFSVNHTPAATLYQTSQPYFSWDVIEMVSTYIGGFLAAILNRLEDLLNSGKMLPNFEFSEAVVSSPSRRNQCWDEGQTRVSRFEYNQQCSLPPKSWQATATNFFSVLGSWKKFYTLNGMYMFNSPRHISPYREIEHTGFYDRYVDPEAMCMAPVLVTEQDGHNEMEFIVSVTKEGRRGTVLYRHDGGEIETTSLLGMRIKFSKDDDYRITMIDGIRIDGMLWVQELHMLKNNDLALETQDDLVFLGGVPVSNMRIIGK